MSLAAKCKDMGLTIGTKAINPEGAAGWPPAFVPTRNPEFPKKLAIAQMCIGTLESTPTLAKSRTYPPLGQQQVLRVDGESNVGWLSKRLHRFALPEMNSPIRPANREGMRQDWRPVLALVPRSIGAEAVTCTGAR